MTAASSSTNDPRGTPPTDAEGFRPAKPIRRKIRPKVHDLQAYQATTPEILSALSGTQYHAEVGAWVILRGGVVIDCLSDQEFTRLYEVVPEKGMTLAPADQATLDQVLGFGATRSSAQLTACVQKLARLEIGEIRVTFTPAQWDELNSRAKKRGWPISKYMEQLVARLTQDVWTSAF